MKSHETPYKPRIHKGKNVSKTEKFCNICGCSVNNYQVTDNAPLCFDCVPKQCIIITEADMYKKILKIA